MSYETGDDVASVLSPNIRGKTGEQWREDTKHANTDGTHPSVLITGGTMGGLGAEFAATIVKHSPKLVILSARSQAM